MNFVGKIIHLVSFTVVKLIQSKNQCIFEDICVVCKNCGKHRNAYKKFRPPLQYAGFYSSFEVY